MPRVRLKDIAERAGVSVTTVSLALRHTGEVAPKRAEEIIRIAEELGYRPNPLLASLASKRFSEAEDRQGTPLAIFEFPVLPDGTWRNTGQYRPALMREARKLGYAPDLYELPDGHTAQTLNKRLYHRMVQGIIVNGSVDMQTFGAEFDWSRFALVQCARYHTGYPFHTVRANIFQGVKLLFTRLHEKGYRRIGFAPGRHEVLLEDDEDRQGCSTAMLTTHLPTKDQLPIYTGLLNDQQAFLEWVRSTKPDVVVGFSVAHYHMLIEAGYRIPVDLGFAAFHNTDSTPGRMAGLLPNHEAVARESIHLLDQHIRTHRRGCVEHPVHLLIPLLWQDGATLRHPG